MRKREQSMAATNVQNISFSGGDVGYMQEGVCVVKITAASNIPSGCLYIYLQLILYRKMSMVNFYIYILLSATYFLGSSSANNLC